MNRVALCAVLTACVCPCPSEHEDPPVVRLWQLSQADRVAIRSATLRDGRELNTNYFAHPSPDATLELVVDLVTATAEFVEDGRPVSHAAPVRLRIFVNDPDGFAIGEPRCIGPNYQGDDMVVTCDYPAIKRDHDVSFTLCAHGSGRIDDCMHP